jgi:hypothetical protein
MFPTQLSDAIDYSTAVCVMILMRFAISIFALALLGLGPIDIHRSQIMAAAR